MHFKRKIALFKNRSHTYFCKTVIFRPMTRFLWLFLLFSSSLAWAQNPITYAFDASNGLPDNEVYDLLQDHNDFIWVAANNGLLRYDGQHFETISLPNQKGTSVFNLTEDEEGAIWCNNLYGQIFKATADSTALMYDVNELLKGDLAKFTIQPNGLLLFSLNGIYQITASGHQKVFNDPVLQYYETARFYLLINHKNELIFVNKTDFSIESKHLLATDGHLKKPQFFRYDGATYLFYTLQEQGYVLRIANTNIHTVQTPKNFQFNKLINLFTVNDNVWFSDDAVVHVANIKNDQLTLTQALFEGEKISDVIIDSQENYWFATLQNGIKVSPNIHLKKIPWNHERYGYIIGATAYTDATALFFTDKAYLVFFDLNAKTWQQFKVPTKRSLSTIRYHFPTNSVFIGVNDNESYIFDIATQHFEQTNDFNVAKDIDFKDDAILYTTFNKTILYEHYGQPKAHIQAIDSSRGYTASYSNYTNNVLLCNANGLWLYDSNFTHATELTYQHEKVFTSSIAETSDGTFWIAGKQEGLFYVKDNQLERYPLPIKDRSIRFIKSYGNELWIVTDKGIEMLHVVTHKHQTYSLRMGVVTPINTLEIMDSAIFYTTNTNIFVIDRSAFRNVKTTCPSLYFTGVAFMDKDTTLQKTYELPYHNNNIKFSFSAHTFNSSEFVKYQYRLKGLSDEWQTTATAEHTVKYFSVPPGTYEFQIKPFFTDTLQEGTTEYIAITIAKPIWLSWWFWAVIAFVFMLSSYQFIRYRSNVKLKRKNEEISKLLLEKRMAGLQLENLRSQMNPHFIFNALNSIQEYIVNNEKKLASAYLVKFSRLMRLYLEHSKVNEISLEEEIRTIDLYLTLEQNRFDGDFTYQIDIPTTLATAHLLVPSLLLQPYIENAIKHGLAHKKGTKTLLISFQKEGDFLEVCIDDNGIGRKAADAINQRTRPGHTSFATQASDKRIEIVNNQQQQKICVTYVDKVTNGNALGTKVCITIPLKNNRP